MNEREREREAERKNSLLSLSLSLMKGIILSIIIEYAELFNNSYNMTKKDYTIFF